MTKNYKEITADISMYLSKMRKEIPDVMNGFSHLAQAATKDGALNKKTKELIALALGIAARCDGCIGFHTQSLVRLGVTREEFLEHYTILNSSNALRASAAYINEGPPPM